MNNTQNCHIETVSKQSSSEELAIVHGAVLEIWGMGCPNCARRVQNSLLELGGMVNAEVDHNSRIALVRFNPTMLTPGKMLLAVEAAGGDGKHEYSARLVSLQQTING